MFTTKEERRENEYQYLKQVLQTSELNTPEKVYAHLERVTQRSKRITLIVAVISIILCILWPKFSLFWLGLSSLWLLWMWGSTMSGKKLMQRYIDEVLSKQTDQLDPSDTEKSSN